MFPAFHFEVSAESAAAFVHSVNTPWRRLPGKQNLPYLIFVT